MIYFHMSIPGMPTLIVRIVSMIKRIEDGQNKLLSIMFLSYEPGFGLSQEKSVDNIFVFFYLEQCTRYLRCIIKTFSVCRRVFVLWACLLYRGGDPDQILPR